MRLDNTSRCRFLPRLVMVEDGANVLGIYVEVDRRHGDLLYTEVPRRILSMGFRILESTTACGARIHRGFYVVDAGEVDQSVLVDSVKRVEGVVRVETSTPWGGILVAPRSDLLSFGNMRAVMFCKDSLISMWEGYLERLGEGLASTLLFWFGYFFGRCMAKQIGRLISNKKDAEPETLQVVLSKFLRSTGWADRVEVSGKRGVYTVKVYGNTECLALSESRHKPRGSNIMRGILAGILSTLRGRHVSVEERGCVARGGRLCEFRITPARG